MFHFWVDYLKYIKKKLLENKLDPKLLILSFTIFFLSGLIIKVFVILEFITELAFGFELALVLAEVAKKILKFYLN